MDALQLLTRGLERWLLVRTGPNAGSRVQQGIKLDVFATSMRNTKQIAAHLQQLSRGDPIVHSDPIQRITDLNQTGLVRRVDSGAGDLTPLGKRVLSEWEELNVANESDDDEIVRQLILVHAGVAAQDPYYMSAYSFWREMRSLHPATEWFAAPIALYMASYFNKTIHGFNPWTIIRTSNARFTNISADVWKRWADDTPTPDSWDSTVGRKLFNPASSAARRSMGRVAFCMALEALLMADEGKDLISELSNWSRLRLADGSSSKVQFGEVQIEKIAGFLQDRCLLDGAAAEALRLLKSHNNVILYGSPGTGKSRAALQIRDRWAAEHTADSVVLTTFHPSYSYEEFVEGWRPDPDRATVAGFNLAEGVLLRAVNSALKSPARNTLLIIDEVNRGDVARIFGEFVTFIEHDKRGIEFTTAQNQGQPRQIPKNLFVLGTMNTADKSISLLDTALRRRFAFVQCAPDPEVFDRSPGLIGQVDGIRLKQLLITINQRLTDQQVETDRQIGHGMLCIPADSSDPMQQLLDRLCYNILPLVAEYLYGEPERIREVLPGLIDDRGFPKRPDEVDDPSFLLADAPPPDDHEYTSEIDNED